LNHENYLESARPVLGTKVVRNAAQRAATEIRGLMGARRFSAADLATVIGVSTSTAVRRMNGESDLTVNELETIAEWLGVPAIRILAPTTGATYSN
jgi:transcriptional regulator with XRE-family HTH domain